MTDPLSPAVKAVDRAIADCIQLLGEVAPSRQVAAAALRAAAEEVVLPKYQYADWQMAHTIMEELQNIAAELEGSNG